MNGYTKKHICNTCFYYHKEADLCESESVDREVYTNDILSVKRDEDSFDVLKCDSYKEESAQTPDESVV